MRASLSATLRSFPRADFALTLIPSPSCRVSGKGKARQDEEDEPDIRKVRALQLSLCWSCTVSLTEPVPQIFFASRTHSQLSQFVAELRKTIFARGDDSLSLPSPPDSTTTSPSPEAARPIRIIPLGSRHTLCINDDVRRKSGGSNEAMGDLCTELQKGGKERCEFLPPLTEPARLNDFRDKALVRPSSCMPLRRPQGAH